MENYENKDRDRCCGLRCGDVVLWYPHTEKNGIYGVIIGFGRFDTNIVFVHADYYNTYWSIAERCYTIEKVEDRGQIHAPAY